MALLNFLFDKKRRGDKDSPAMPAAQAATTPAPTAPTAPAPASPVAEAPKPLTPSAPQGPNLDQIRRELEEISALIGPGDSYGLLREGEGDMTPIQIPLDTLRELAGKAFSHRAAAIDGRRLVNILVPNLHEQLAEGTVLCTIGNLVADLDEDYLAANLHSIRDEKIDLPLPLVVSALMPDELAAPTSQVDREPSLQTMPDVFAALDTDEPAEKAAATAEPTPAAPPAPEIQKPAPAAPAVSAPTPPTAKEEPTPAPLAPAAETPAPIQPPEAPVRTGLTPPEGLDLPSMPADWQDSEDAEARVEKEFEAAFGIKADLFASPSAEREQEVTKIELPEPREEDPEAKAEREFAAMFGDTTMFSPPEPEAPPAPHAPTPPPVPAATPTTPAPAAEQPAPPVEMPPIAARLEEDVFKRLSPEPEAPGEIPEETPEAIVATPSIEAEFTQEMDQAPKMRGPVEIAGLDLNTAAAGDLVTRLDGVGPKLAVRIVEDRELNGPFLDIYDLARVQGVGRKTFETITGREWREDLCTRREILGHILDASKHEIPDIRAVANRVRSVNGFEGCVIAHRDGYVLATSWNHRVNDVLGAFAPQMFKKVVRYVKRLDLGEMDAFTFFFEDLPITLVNSGDIFLAAIHTSNRFSRRHVQIARTLTLELDRRLQRLRGDED